MLFRNWSIGVRLSAGFAALGIITLLLGAMSLMQMRQMNESAEEVQQNWMPSVVAISNISEAAYQIRLHTLRSLLSGDAVQVREASKNIQAARDYLEDSKKTYVSLISTDAERNAYQQVLSAESAYGDGQKQVESLMAQGDLPAAMVAQVRLLPLADALQARLDALTAAAQNGAQEAVRVSEQAYHEAWRVVVLLGLLGAGLTVMLALLLTRSIVTPLSTAVLAARGIAAGQLNAEISVTGKDEAAELLGALGDMQQHLRGTIRLIADSSTQLASAAEELHGVTDNATQALHRQTQELEQAATAVNEMTVASEEVAQNASNTSEASRQSDETARQGLHQVEATVKAITELSSNVTVNATATQTLASSVREIGQVLDVIRSIADQTNLLALNAAIEAARAGEQGRGFAVVADEVRALARRTQESTESIEVMIEAIEQAATRTVNAMQGSMENARATQHTAEETGEVLVQITEAVSGINERNLLIASAAQEQAYAAREVDRNLVNIRDLALQSAAGADQASASSQALSRLAVELKRQVGRFVL
ncbi:methyl-accepting chemotaxis protein [Pseudomonas wadenswilerensis]